MMQINDMEFNVQVKGEGDVLIWGHGVTASMTSEDLLNIFEWNKFPKDKKLVRYDARGHGKTEPSFSPSDYHWKNMARDMISIADGLGIEEFVAGGQSMGCATTIYAGMEFPNRVRSMILMNPPTAWETRAAQGDYYNKLAKIGGLLGGGILAKVMGRNPERLLPSWLVEAKKEDVLGLLEGIKPMKRKTLSNLFKGAALTDLPSREKIKTINIPALILGWTGDPTHPVETAIELDKLMPQSTLVVAENYSEFANWPQLIREFVIKTT
jgi:pimeloyl-ACP methyl ester carboxylesterase